VAKDHSSQSAGSEQTGYNTSDTMPSNVGELLTRVQLDNARDAYKLLETRSELNPYQDRELAVKIINKLVDYHTNSISRLVDEGKADEISTWAIDHHRLTLAIELLEQVELSDN